MAATKRSEMEKAEAALRRAEERLNAAHTSRALACSFANMDKWDARVQRAEAAVEKAEGRVIRARIAEHEAKSPRCGETMPGGTACARPRCHDGDHEDEAGRVWDASNYGRTPVSSSEREARSRPSVQQQGKVVVEIDGGAFLAMFPDGEVNAYASREQVLAAAKAWFAKHVDAQAIGFGSIEWR